MAAQVKVGDEVRITSAPFEWMELLVGDVGQVAEVQPRGEYTAVKVEGLPCGQLWFIGRYLEVVADAGQDSLSEARREKARRLLFGEDEEATA